MSFTQKVVLAVLTFFILPLAKDYVTEHYIHKSAYESRVVEVKQTR